MGSESAKDLDNWCDCHGHICGNGFPAKFLIESFVRKSCEVISAGYADHLLVISCNRSQGTIDRHPQ